jgi:hypothetical protein
MQRYIGLNVHTASSTLAVVSENGRRLKSFPVEANGRALVEAIRMIAGQKASGDRKRYPERVALRDSLAARRMVCGDRRRIA